MENINKQYKVEKKNPFIESQDVSSRWMGWVNNRMTMLIWDLQRNRLKDRRLLLKHEFFLEDLEHHFMDCHAEPKIWKAFCYLQRYLKTYPQAKPAHVKKALKMLSLIYEQLGFEG